MQCKSLKQRFVLLSMKNLEAYDKDQLKVNIKQVVIKNAQIHRILMRCMQIGQNIRRSVYTHFKIIMK